MLVIGAVLLPTLLLFSWMIWRSYDNERRSIERQVVSEVDSLSRLIDSFLETREAVLRTLATAQSLEGSNLEEFHDRAKRAVPGTTEWIVLADAQGRMLVHTEHPYGTILPDGAGPYLAPTAAGLTYFSDLLLRGPATGKTVVYIAYPVKIGGECYSLHYVIAAPALTHILQRSSLVESRIAAVVDREGRVIARNRRIEDFLGALATPELQHARAHSDRGQLYGNSLEQVSSVIAFNTSRKTGWSAVVSVPASTLFTPARGMLQVALISLVCVTGLALLLAASFASKVIRAVNTLVAGTKAIAAGDASVLEDTGMNETDQVMRALRDAATQLRSRETEIARSRDEALEASRVKDEFLATLSHELRTPLNPVLLLATDGAADPRHPAETQAAFAAIAKNVSLEARLIDDMLDVTRISRGKLNLKLRDVELHEVLRDALATVELDLSDKQLEVVTTFEAVPAWISADNVRLQQVFWNLLKNAAKFSPARDVVQISTRRLPAGQVEIVIADRGIGMTDEELARSFRRFEQGAHGLGGLGLGLAISRSLVDLHGGTLSATSAGRNLGATFTVQLPTVTTSIVATPARAATMENAKPVLSAPALLLVEDHEPSRLVLGRLLERRGYEVVPAATMQEAVAIFSTRDFAVVISDLGLPDGDGCELLRNLRTVRPVVAVAVSGYGMDDDRQRSLAAGFVDHLVKPVGIESINRALKRVQQEMAR